MSERPPVSIILPTYNHAAMLEKGLESISGTTETMLAKAVRPTIEMCRRVCNVAEASIVTFCVATAALRIGCLDA